MGGGRQQQIVEQEQENEDNDKDERPQKEVNDVTAVGDEDDGLLQHLRLTCQLCSILDIGGNTCLMPSQLWATLSLGSIWHGRWRITHTMSSTSTRWLARVLA
jgi:hypothetical protein